ncbi:MAG: SMC family ATPase [Actinomycetota bacterium]|nr:SMC family ATPase [Actinomycetota bacterium]
MRITRVYLKNYRVYEEPVEFELPPGLVGIYGLNGSGKSTLLESIRFALFGRARTSIDQVRTADVNAESVVELEFEHEGHLYVVRRTIGGANATVKASAAADGFQVAEGARDTARYVHSVLGMDDAAFRASVFAEQKQLSAFSEQGPTERRKLVLQLLGITPVDAARDRARKEARDTAQQVERLRSILPDLDALRADAEARRMQAEEAVTVLEGEERTVIAARAGLERAQAALDQIDGRRQEHDLVASEAATVRAELERARARLERLVAEVAELDRAARRLAELAPDADGCEAVELRLRAVEAVVAAEERVAAAGLAPQPPAPDELKWEAARAEAEAARARLAEVDGLIRAAREERQRAVDALSRSSTLSGEADCPLCGQALGEAFEQVQAHRAAEVAEIEQRGKALVEERRRLAAVAAEGDRLLRERTDELRRARASWAAYEQAQARRAEAERALARAHTVLAECGAASEGNSAELAAMVPLLRAEVGRRRAAAEEAGRLRGRLENRARLEADLEAEQLAAGDRQGRLTTLTDKLVAIGFVPEELRAARAERDRCRRVFEESERRLESARLAAVSATSAADVAAQRVVDAEAQHAKLREQEDEARHQGRLAELLNAFRNSLVASVGPRLSAQAGELFANLTDREYEALEVDPETYEIKVRDGGRLYGLDRFSGSETDLANLALRVAISEHVQFQSGGTVGLLVLDEVFGPLDDDRKGRMLLALERLKARFRQVLVVTHDAAIKEQLPHALEVVKLPQRRATVRPLTP